ncbi:endo alpha-1,4 polygalactosaminidase [Paractinoplanes durhamensis]|uniref:endo alpha-1,4 polygalactosaminidase n=1 Tax=Paractinoplanes durhamensis TaxID=113563 RepID=UPI0036440310
MTRLAALLLITAMLAGCAGGEDEPAPAASSAAVTSSPAVTPSRDATPSPAAAPEQAWELPPANGRFDYQLGGAYPPDTNVKIVDRDRTAKPAPGVYSICYVNAFQTQPGENSWWQRHHNDLLLREKDGYVEDEDWPDERLLDISTAAKRTALAGIIGGWFADCAKAGFRAVEPDNLDSYTRSKDVCSGTRPSRTRKC